MRKPMKTTFTALVILVGAAALSACELSRQQTGTVLGGAAGAAAGSTIGSGRGRTAAILVGGLIGAAAGRSVGQHMDEQDRMRTGQALETTPTGQATTWRNPDTGAAYTLTPTRTYDSAGQPCREFRMNADVDGQPSEVQGTACRQPDGSWKMTG